MSKLGKNFAVAMKFVTKVKDKASIIMYVQVDKNSKIKSTLY